VGWTVDEVVQREHLGIHVELGYMFSDMYIMSPFVGSWHEPEPMLLGIRKPDI
jgi:hypothetical protein